MNTEVSIQPPKLTLKERFMEAWNKFYSNKKIFWLVVSLFSLIVLITIAGIIFRLVKGGRATTTQAPTPTPTTEAVQQEGKKEPLDLAKEELQKLETQIKNLDIKQQRLSPPVVNFKVDF